MVLVGLWMVMVWWQPETAGVRRVFEENFARHRTAQAARDLGRFLIKEGDRAAARRALEEALRLDESELGARAAQTLEDAGTLAGISAAAQAEPLWRRAAEAADPSVAGPALASLGGLRAAAGDRPGAAECYRRAAGKAEAIEGRNGPTVALVLIELAVVAEPKEALEALRRAVAIDRQALGPRHPQTALAMRALANLEQRIKASGK